MSRRYSRIAGTGSYLPPRRVSNDDLVKELAARGIETSDQWIVERTGIQARHFAAPDVPASDLAVPAARAALEAAGLAFQISVEVGVVSDSPARRNAAAAAERLRQAEEIVQNDTFVRSMVHDFGAKIIPDSKKPLKVPARRRLWPPYLISIDSQEGLPCSTKDNSPDS